MLKRRSLFECCVTLPVGTWSFARKQLIRSVGGHVRNLTTSYFERKEIKFVGNKTAIYVWNRSSLCLLFVKLAHLCVFSSFIRPITSARASREHAFDAGGSAKPEPQQRRQWEGANVRQKNPSPHVQTLRSPKIRERLVDTPRSTARSFTTPASSFSSSSLVTPFPPPPLSLPLSLSLSLSFPFRTKPFGERRKLTGKELTYVLVPIDVVRYPMNTVGHQKEVVSIFSSGRNKTQ